MLKLVLLFLAVIPVVVILTFIYLKDRSKEPVWLLVVLFLLGIGSCFVTLGISEVVHMIFPFMNKGTEYMTFFEIMAYAFIGVALVEEFSKFLMVYVCGYKNKAYDEVYDGIVYAVFVSLGFAFFENLLYVFSNNSVGVGIARGLLAVPGHACDAVFMGYYLSVAKVYSRQGNKSAERKNLIMSVAAPMVLHGIYDFCLFVNMGLFVLIFIAFVVVMYIAAFKKIKQLSHSIPKQPQPLQNKGQWKTPQVEQPNVAPMNNMQPMNNMNNMQPMNSQFGYNQPTFEQQLPPPPVLPQPDVQPQQQEQQPQKPHKNRGGFTSNDNVSEMPTFSNPNAFGGPTGFQNQMQPQYGGFNNLGPNIPQAPSIPPQTGFCSSCGAPINGEFCSKCGARQN